MRCYTLQAAISAASGLGRQNKFIWAPYSLTPRLRVWEDGSRAPVITNNLYPALHGKVVKMPTMVESRTRQDVGIDQLVFSKGFDASCVR